jgi:ATP-dependent DNA helicase RecQ
MPSGLDAYYQEAGRAGRDGAPSACTLLFLRRDRALQQFFLTGRYPTQEELDALLRSLERSPQNASGETLAQLKDGTGLPQNKLKAAVGLLRNRRIVGVDREGRVRLLRADLAATEIHELLDAYRRKREQDHATLERMVFYAQSGQCRWQVLLAYLEEEAPPERCGHCDNCRRIARHEAAMAAAGAAESGAPKLRHPARPRLPAPAFVARQPVRVKRYGEGCVVSADALSITIEFADGSRRCFQPDFVQPIVSRKKRGEASRSSARTG